VIASPFLLTAPLPSGNIGEIRDRFEPQGYATVSDATAEPRRLVCLGDNACPSVSRHWVFDAPFTTAELQQWIDDAGYALAVDGDCSSGYCEVFGNSGGWTVHILFGRGTASNEQLQLSLYLR
jgi:hypothetical protein